MIYRFAQCELNTQLIELKRNGQSVAIEPQVFRLLSLLIENKQRVLSKDEILSTIWSDRVVSDSALSSGIKAARQAIGDSGEQQTLIKTVRGHGFRFVGELHEPATTAVQAPQPTSAKTTASNDNSQTATVPLNNSLPIKISHTPLSGRESELNKLEELLESSLTQIEQVVLLSGSAGVGKSRLLEEISKVAAQKNMRILWGLCREESGAPAYWPWRQLLVSHFLSQPWLASKEHPELAQLLPELFADYQGIKNQAASESIQSSAQSRFKLFHSIAKLLTHAVSEFPLFLVFDDLHRADQASLSLLEFIATELSHQSVFIVGTYRDTDLTEGHRFFHTLSEFSRLVQFHSIPLKHLTSSAVENWILDTLPETSNNLIAQINKRTDGHPLYLSETIRHLQQGGDPQKLPISLKAIINQRFAHLPSDSVEVLRAAALVGRRFGVSTLSHILAISPQKVLEKLDHAVMTGQLTPLVEPGYYQFSHIIIRETLYDSLLNSDRLHLHCNLAEHLEQQQAESGSIAFHYHQAAPLGMTEKATHYAKLAAEEADKLLAFEISSSYYKQALRTANQEQKLDLLIALGQSKVKAGESVEAITIFDQAIKMAEQMQQFKYFALAAIGMEEAVWRPGISGHKVIKLLHSAFNKVDANNIELKLKVICALLRAQMMCGVLDKDIALLKQAQEYSKEVNEPELNIRVLLAELYSTLVENPSNELFEARISIANKATDIVKTIDNDSLYIEVLSWQMQDLFVYGKSKEIAILLKQQLRYGVATKQPFFRYYTTMWETLFYAANGDFSAAQKSATAGLDYCRWLPGQDSEGVFGLQMFTIKREQGVLFGMTHIVQKFVEDTPQHSHWLPRLALIYTDIGQLDKAKTIFDDLLSSNLSAIAKDAMWLTCIAYLSEVCLQLKDANAAKILYQALLPHSGFNILVGANICTLGSTDRYLGLLAITMQDYELAEQYLSKAIKNNQQQGFYVYAAHSRYELAEMMSQRKHSCDREQAQSLVDEVLKFSEKTKMQALHKKALLLRSKVRSGPEMRSEDEFGLSKREQQVLQLIALGKQNKEIAEQLFISNNTVAAHIRNILEKTGTSNRIEASNLASKLKL